MEDLMSIDNELSQKLINQVESGNKLDQVGNHKEAIQIYLLAWKQLPEPKTHIP